MRTTTPFWRNQACCIAALAAVTLSASATFAGDPHGGHAGDVFVGVEFDHIVTGLIDADDVMLDVRVFESELGELGVPGFSDEPGWEAFPGTFAPSSRVGWNAPEGIRRWNGDGLDAGIAETLTVTYDTLSFVIGETAVDGFDLAVQPDGGLHRHLGFLLNGESGGAQVGVYVVELELYSTDPSLEHSSPFWIVFNNEASEADHEAAVEWVHTHLADEAPCHGDVNGDHHVDVSDLLGLLSDWGSCSGCATDLDGSGAVDVEDLLQLLAVFGDCH
ncbi:MAG: hypothetical protein QF733_09570 [Phycisphaerales bacterium]|jgi:hypothetical protein|nr:hypothetical protein [Phycisphaerales bacterium]